jgi:hypothetical protein
VISLPIASAGFLMALVALVVSFSQGRRTVPEIAPASGDEIARTVETIARFVTFGILGLVISGIGLVAFTAVGPWGVAGC